MCLLHATYEGESLCMHRGGSLKIKKQLLLSVSVANRNMGHVESSSYYQRMVVYKTFIYVSCILCFYFPNFIDSKVASKHFILLIENILV